MSKITVTETRRTLVVRIPKGILVFAAENNDELPLKIKKKRQFYKLICEQLQTELYDAETGLTDFEQLLDKAVEKVAESGDDCVALIEEE